MVFDNFSVPESIYSPTFVNFRANGQSTRPGIQSQWKISAKYYEKAHPDIQPRVDVRLRLCPSGTVFIRDYIRLCSVETVSTKNFGTAASIGKEGPGENLVCHPENALLGPLGKTQCL